MLLSVFSHTRTCGTRAHFRVYTARANFYFQFELSLGTFTSTVISARRELIGHSRTYIIYIHTVVCFFVCLK